VSRSAPEGESITGAGHAEPGKKKTAKNYRYENENLLSESSMDMSEEEADEELTHNKKSSKKSSNMSISEHITGKLRLGSTSSVFEKDSPPPHTAKTPVKMPDEYYRARTARRAGETRQAINGIGPLTRAGETAKSYRVGSFDAIDDSRLMKVVKVHSVARKANYTLSFDPELMKCTACDSGHDIVAEKTPTLIILSDQNFPPHLSPADPSNTCAAIIRVEDASLGELVGVFSDVFRNMVGGGAGRTGLPAGSVVAIASLSDLERSGLERHADDLVRYISVIAAKVGAGTTVIPGVSVPLYGVGAGPVLRDWANLDAWLSGMKASGCFTLPDTRHENWSALLGELEENQFPEKAIVLTLPISLKNSRKFPAELDDFEYTIPDKIDSIPEKTEGLLIENLYRELNGRFFLRLESKPSVDRGNAAAGGPEKKKIYIIGASHARNLRAPLAARGQDLVPLPQWAPTMEAAGKIEKALLADPPKKGDIVYMDILSNTFITGTDDDGAAVAPVFSNGKYHLLGSVEAATRGTIRKITDMAASLVSASKHATIILAVPLPRYVKSKCCDMPGHITNFGTEDMDMTMKLARGRCETALMALGIDNTDGAAEILDAATELGDQLIFASDGVHLTEATYNKHADIIMERATGEAANTTSKMARARAHSIITEPASRKQPEKLPPAPVPVPVPAWILGEDGSGSGPRGRGSYRSGFRGGGRWRGGRARPPRGRMGFHPYHRGGH